MGQPHGHPDRTLNAFAALQHVLPKQAISRMAGWAARSERRLVAGPLIRAFARHYRVDMAEAADPSLAGYPSFNAFFTRALRADARPMPDAATAIVSPADGYLSQFGHIEDGRIVQAKGRDFSVAALVADATLADSLNGGVFLTVYLSPRDYHRVHAPARATLRRTIEVPGRLYSVNDRTAAGVPGLFARNERLVCVFDEFVLVLVGALIVASIETVWEGPRSPYPTLRTRPAAGEFPRGAEVGRFLLGSTAIVLFPPGTVALRDDLAAGMALRVGQPVGTA